MAKKNSNSVMLAGLFIAFIIMAPKAAIANECNVHNKLIKLVLYSEQFLDELATANHPEAPELLGSFLFANPTLVLRAEMARAGLEKFEKQAIKIVTEQKILLDLQRFVGRKNTEQRAIKMRAHQTLAKFRRRIASALCNSNGSFGYAESNHAENKMLSSQTAVSLLAFFAMLVFALLYLIELRNKIKRRKSKRYPCNLECTYSLSNRAHEAVIVDISCLGAKLKTDIECSPGDTANIKVGNVNLNVHVQWQNPTYMGVNFAKEFPIDILQRILTRSSECHSQDAVPQLA